MECLGLECDSDKCFYDPKYCVEPDESENSDFVMPLCQYPRGSDCYKNANLTLSEQYQKDELRILKETDHRIYYGSTKQVNFEICFNL